MIDKVFVDTNIFVYATIENESDTLKRNKSIDIFRNPENIIVASLQVINEYYVSLLKNNVTEPEIRERIEEIVVDAEIVDISFNTIRNAWNIKDRYKYSYWDSMIIASAIESGCSILYSEDFQHNRTIDNSLKIRNPFK